MTTRTLFTDSDPTPASTPLRIVPREVRFPATWDASARRMAEVRQMTQADVDQIEAELAQFRAAQTASFLKGVDRDIALAQAEIARAGHDLKEAHETYLHRVETAKRRPQTTQRTLNVIKDDYHYERGEIRFRIWESKRRIEWMKTKRQRLQENAA